jgi:hypothetical protein
MCKVPFLGISVVQQACQAPPLEKQQPQPQPQQQQQHQPLAPEGSAAHKHALKCLQLLLKTLDGHFLSMLSLDAPLVAQQLRECVWRGVVSADEPLLELLVDVLGVLVPALLSVAADAARSADDEALEGGQDGAAAVAAHRCRLAAAQCVKLLLVEVPGSLAVPRLIQVLALQVQPTANSLTCYLMEAWVHAQCRLWCQRC